MREEAERSLDQVCMNWLEVRALKGLLVASRMPGKQILDVPCGYGRFWPAFGSLGIRMIGVDRDPAMVLKAAQGKAGGGGPRASVGDIFHLPFRDNSFECVVCIRFLHLNYSDVERTAILRELARVSSRLVVISIYRFTKLHALMRRINGTPGRLRLMTPRELRNLTQASGLVQQAVWRLLPLIHMQTFVVLTKSVPVDPARLSDL